MAESNLHRQAGLVGATASVGAMRGIVYTAYGTKAREEAMQSMAGVELPVAVISDKGINGTNTIYYPDADKGARLAKLNMYELTPFDQTLYLDADTRVRGNVSAGFEVLEDGWDVAMTYSERQGADMLGNCTPEDRAYTVDLLGLDRLALQAGVMFFRKCETVRALFAVWRAEWERFRQKDQAALLRALEQVPVRLWLLGRPWNGGELVEHRFGAAAR